MALVGGKPISYHIFLPSLCVHELSPVAFYASCVPSTHVRVPSLYILHPLSCSAWGALICNVLGVEYGIYRQGRRKAEAEEANELKAIPTANYRYSDSDPDEPV